MNLLTRYIGNDLIEWVLEVEAATFYAQLLGDYLTTHNDQGVRDDLKALKDAIRVARFLDDEDE